MDKRIRRSLKSAHIFRLISVTVSVILAISVCFAESTAKETEEPYYKGVELASLGKFAESKVEFEKALSDDDFYAAAKLELHAINDVLKGKIKKETALIAFEGKQLAVDQRWEEALAKYSKAIKANPNYAYAFINRGIIYGENGMFDKAISNFSEALDVDPQYTEAYNNRGVLYQLKGRYNNAINDFTRAIAADPKIVRLYYNRGLVYSYRGQYDIAIPDFNKAIELKPDYVKAYMAKAIACDKSGLKAEAIEAYRKAIEFDRSKDPEMLKFVDEAVKRLEASEEKTGEKK